MITPSNVTQDDYALLYIALGFYGSVQVPSAFVSRLDEDVKAAADMASAAGTRAAVLFNVPSEYLTLKSPMPSTQPLVEALPLKVWKYDEVWILRDLKGFTGISYG